MNYFPGQGVYIAVLFDQKPGANLKLKIMKNDKNAIDFAIWLGINNYIYDSITQQQYIKYDFLIKGTEYPEDAYFGILRPIEEVYQIFVKHQKRK